MKSFSPEKKEPADFWSPFPKTNKPEITADKTVNDVLGEKAIKREFYTRKTFIFHNHSCLAENRLSVLLCMNGGSVALLQDCPLTGVDLADCILHTFNGHIKCWQSIYRLWSSLAGKHFCNVYYWRHFKAKCEASTCTQTHIMWGIVVTSLMGHMSMRWALTFPSLKRQ